MDRQTDGWTDGWMDRWMETTLQHLLNETNESMVTLVIYKRELKEDQKCNKIIIDKKVETLLFWLFRQSGEIIFSIFLCGSWERAPTVWGL